MGFEAESAAVVDGAFVPLADEEASAKAVLVQPSSVADASGLQEAATIQFSVPTAGRWSLWTRVHADSSDEASFRLGVNGVSHVAKPATIGEYSWVLVAPYQLPAGTHEIAIGHAGSHLKLDLLVVTDAELDAHDLETWQADNEPPPATVPTVTPQ